MTADGHGQPEWHASGGRLESGLDAGLPLVFVVYGELISHRSIIRHDRRYVSGDLRPCGSLARATPNFGDGFLARSEPSREPVMAAY